MTDTKKALEMAIKALEDAQKCLMGHLFLEKLPYVEAINACKEALEQPAQEHLSWMNLHKELGFMKWIGADEGWDKAIEAVRNRLIELSETTSTHVAIVSETYQSRHTIELNGKGLHQGTKLYTHPKQWQGLSDEEIWDIANFLGKNKEWDYPVMFAKTIEMHLKEKNT